MPRGSGPGLRARWLAAVSIPAAVSILAIACGEPEARPRQIDEAPVLPPPADALEEAIRARAPSEAMLMIPDGDVTRGRLAVGDDLDVVAVLRAGLCYKVLGQGGPGVEDLDLVVHDPNGVLLQRDASEHDRPVIGVERAICPAESGVYRIVVSMRRGAGEFAVQRWVSQ